jgi:endonuclease G
VTKTVVYSLLYLFSFSLCAHANGLEPIGHCDQKISHNYYKICYSWDHKQAFWTYHHLTKKSITGGSQRKNDYRMDSHLDDPVFKYDYKNTGFDRGHLVPAGDMKLNKTAMSDSFYMSNMSPQRPSFNRGIWASLEVAVRNMVISLGDAYVVSAPILDNHLSQIKSGVTVPKWYYKVIYFPQKQLMKAYLLENKSHKGHKYSEYQVSVNQIEALTGYDFFAGLDDQLE